MCGTHSNGDNPPFTDLFFDSNLLSSIYTDVHGSENEDMRLTIGEYQSIDCDVYWMISSK